MTQPILVVEVDSSGATVTIDPDSSVVPQIVWLKPQGGGTITLGGNWSIAFSSDPAQGNETKFIWIGGDIQLGGYTLQIQSQSISDEQLAVNGAFTAITVDESGTQQFIYTPHFDTTESLNGQAIITNTLPLDRIVSVADANLLTGDGSGVIAAPVIGDVQVTQSGGNLTATIQPGVVTNAKLDDLASGYLKVGNGSNRPADVQMTGDVTMDNAGVTTIGVGVITPDKLSFSAGVAAVAQISISSADLTSGNTTPKIAVPAVSGATIVPIKAIFTYVYNGTPYTTNVNVALLHDTATSIIGSLPNALDKTVSYSAQFAFGLIGSGITETQYLQNRDLLFRVEVGDAAAGNGTATLTVWYNLL